MGIHEQADREVDRLEEQYERGELTAEELRAGMREISEELQDYAREQAEDAYRDAMGGW
jgi:DNA-directed RNA polymerase beta' subunit